MLALSKSPSYCFAVFWCGDIQVSRCPFLSGLFSSWIFPYESVSPFSVMATEEKKAEEEVRHNSKPDEAMMVDDQAMVPSVPSNNMVGEKNLTPEQQQKDLVLDHG